MLGGIVREAHERVAVLRANPAAIAALERAAADRTQPPSFANALRGTTVAVIAEVKRFSPSKGAINAALGAPEQAAAYERGGASAISVLTEPRHFAGSLADLDAVRRVVSLPLLRKDFIVDDVQLLEAAASGAAAALLISRALPPDHLAHLAETARGIGIEPLVEVRGETELERALAAGARVVGVNNRDLETLVIDRTVGDRLLPQVPFDRIAISESGVETPADVSRAAAAGADAVLVGSSLSAAADPTHAVRALVGMQRVARAR